MTTTYLSFDLAENAERFVGAALDQGARAEDISVIAYPGVLDKDGYDIAKGAEKGITTTTAQDAGTGAAAGAGVGLGVGVLAGLAAIFIPGFGLVMGGGALATAIAGAAATAGAGAVAGGLTGYLKDMGVEGSVPEDFEKDYKGGKVVVGVAYHEKGISPENLSLLARKYHAARTSSEMPAVSDVDERPMTTTGAPMPRYDLGREDTIPNDDSGVTLRDRDVTSEDTIPERDYRTVGNISDREVSDMDTDIDSEPELDENGEPIAVDERKRYMS